MDWNHVLVREWIHFRWGLILGPVAYWGWVLAKRYTDVGKYEARICSTFILLTFIMAREPYDAHKAYGPMWWKSYIDIAVWVGVLGFSAWLGEKFWAKWRYNLRDFLKKGWIWLKELSSQVVTDFQRIFK